MESEQQRTWLEPWGTAAAYDILTEAVVTALKDLYGGVCLAYDSLGTCNV